MIGQLVLATIGAFILFGLSTHVPGRIGRYLQIAIGAVAAAAAAGAALALFVHPGWDTTETLPRVNGRGAVIAAIWQLGISLGPKPIGLAFAAFSYFVGSGTWALVGEARAGDFRTLADQEADDALNKKARALVEAFKSATETARSIEAAIAAKASKRYPDAASAADACQEITDMQATARAQKVLALECADKLKKLRPDAFKSRGS